MMGDTGHLHKTMEGGPRVKKQLEPIIRRICAKMLSRKRLVRAYVT